MRDAVELQVQAELARQEAWQQRESLQTGHDRDALDQRRPAGGTLRIGGEEASDSERIIDLSSASETSTSSS